MACSCAYLWPLHPQGRVSWAFWRLHHETWWKLLSKMRWNSASIRWRRVGYWCTVSHAVPKWPVEQAKCWWTMTFWGDYPIFRQNQIEYRWVTYIYTLKFILPKYFGRLCRYYFVWSVLRKPGVSQKTHTNLMKTRRHAKKIGDASGLSLLLP